MDLSADMNAAIGFALGLLIIVGLFASFWHQRD